MRSASRAACASARLGLSRVVRSRWRGRLGSSSTGSSGSRRARRRPRPGQADEHDREPEVERGVEVDHDPAGSALSSCSQRHRELDERQGEHAAAAEHEVAERHAARGRLVGERGGHRRQRRAEVGAQHQGAGAHRAREHADAGERHDQQHDRKPGVGEPGQQRCHQHRISASSVERGEQMLTIAASRDRRRGGQEQAQRKQHQAEAERHAAEPAIVRALGRRGRSRRRRGS